MGTMETAIILAGGKSSRMGFDKQFMKLDGRYIIDIILDKLSSFFSEFIIVTNRPEAYRQYSCKVVRDEVENFGPLGGIHAGLKHSGSRYNYLIACDMPYINKEYIRYMKGLLLDRKEGADAVITRLGDWIEPFNAFYSTGLLGHIENSINHNVRQINVMLKDANVIYVAEGKAREYSPGWEMFINLNTVRDYEKHKKSSEE